MKVNVNRSFLTYFIVYLSKIYYQKRKKNVGWGFGSIHQKVSSKLIKLN